MSAAAASATAVESTAAATYRRAVKAIASANHGRAVESIPAANYWRAMESATTVNCDAAMIPAARVTVHRSAIEGTPVNWTAVEAMEPRTRADENSADEILRPVIPVGRASVRVIPIVTVGADGRRSNISGADSNSDSDPHLRISPAY
jgi:hypothetical protein